MIAAIYSIIKEIYEKRVELIITLIISAITLGIGIYVISTVTSDLSNLPSIQNLSHIKSAI